MQLCNCSLPCCFSARWCHRLSRQGWEGDLGRWWRSVCVCVCVWSRGGVFLPDCIIKLLRQALSALSCLFSSLFATSRLLSSRRGICCSNSEVFRGGVSGWVQECWRERKGKSTTLLLSRSETFSSSRDTNICPGWCVSAARCSPASCCSL